LPKLPPPPKRLASAVTANKLRQVKAIVNNIKNLFIYSSKVVLIKAGASISPVAAPTVAEQIEQRQEKKLLIKNKIRENHFILEGSRIASPPTAKAPLP